MTGTSHTHIRTGQAPNGLLAGNQLADKHPTSPGLPEGVWRDRFLEIITEAHRDMLTPSDERVLRFYASQTRPADWSDPGRGPICYVGQLNTAERLRLDRKTVYSAERRLEALGLIEKTALANGHRRGPRGLRVESAPLGICFAPAIERYEALSTMVLIAQEAREQLGAMRYRVSGLRTRLRIALRDCSVQDSTTDAITNDFEALPTQIARIGNLETLTGLEAQFQGLLDDLSEHIDAQRREEDTGDSSSIMGKIPHKGGQDSPHHIYTTTNPSSVLCTPTGDEWTGANAPDTCQTEPAQAGKMLESKHVSQTGPVNWTIAQLCNAATSTFRSCINVRAEQDASITSDLVVDAAADMAAILGINHSAWIDACNVMGRFDAALAVIVIDRNRSHPLTPIKLPGGTLRAMTARARSGDLNIDASIFAILRRSDDGIDRVN